MNIEWKEEHIEYLRECANKGLSGSEMAEELSKRFSIHLTRNAIIGKAHRLGIKFGKSSSKKIEFITEKKVGNKVKAIRQPVKREDRQILEIKPKKDLQLKTISILADKKRMHDFYNPNAFGVELIDLREGQCRYPMGDVRTNDLLFCGEPIDKTKQSSYCSYCHTVVYMPIRKYQEMTATRNK